MNKGRLYDVLRIARWVAGSFALFFGVLLATHVLGRGLGFGPGGLSGSGDDVYWALATSAPCLVALVIARALRARAGTWKGGWLG